MELFGKAFFPEFLVRPSAANLTEGPGISQNWSANSGESVMDVLGDTRGLVSGVLTVESFIALRDGSKPSRIPVVPYENNRDYPVDFRSSLRYFLGLRSS